MSCPYGDTIHYCTDPSSHAETFGEFIPWSGTAEEANHVLAVIHRMLVDGEHSDDR